MDFIFGFHHWMGFNAMGFVSLIRALSLCRIIMPNRSFLPGATWCFIYSVARKRFSLLLVGSNYFAMPGLLPDEMEIGDLLRRQRGWRRREVESYGNQIGLWRIFTQRIICFLYCKAETANFFPTAGRASCSLAISLSNCFSTMNISSHSVP